LLIGVGLYWFHIALKKLTDEGEDNEIKVDCLVIVIASSLNVSSGQFFQKLM
jgi:hypothetical protein